MFNRHGALTKRDIETFLRAAITSPTKKNQGNAGSALEPGEGDEEVEVVRSGGPISLTQEHEWRSQARLSV